MPHCSVGVIGHVNHGKTSLVKVLTGTDTDRLEEERRRGMSIVLGFACLHTARGTLDLIDVPGHEQFVRTMVSGATGIDATLLVVNGREGVMPQTVEHVAIADLLGVRRGVVAITRSDLMAPAARAQAQQRVRAFLRGTHLEFAPITFVSALTGEGTTELAHHLAALLGHDERHDATRSHFWLPVDRVFSVPGYGTVATGTLRGAAMRPSDAVACFPQGTVGAVRQLQVHGEPVDVAYPGQRVGVNLRHLAAGELTRGTVLAPPVSLGASDLVDLSLSLLPQVRAQDVEGCRVRLLFGTTEVAGVVRVLSSDAGGRQGLLAQMRLARPVVAVPGEACILRRESPPRTLGGGRVLDTPPRRHARTDATALRRLRILAGGSERERLAERLRQAGAAGLPLAIVAAQSGLAAEQLAPVLRELAFIEGARAWHLALAVELRERMLAALRSWHAAHPMKAAAPLVVCQAAIPPASGDALQRALLDRLQADGCIVRRDGQVALAGHDPLRALDEPSLARLQALDQRYRAGGMQPPDPPAVHERERALLELMVARGDILLLPGQPPTQRIALHAAAVANAKDRLLAAYPPPAGFTVSEARALLGSTRKFTVPLLQHLHASGLTRRRGDLHAFVDNALGGV